MIVSGLQRAGVTSLFPVQTATLGATLQGKDVIVRSRTGTGKTLAFVLPVAHQLLGTAPDARQKPKRGRAPRALVLAPTRELALQVAREFERFAPYLKTVTVYGGASIGHQARELRAGVDVVVGTPGRVVDMSQRNSLNLSQIQMFVLDEADEMLKMGFEAQMEAVMDSLPDKDERQTMLWSATVPAWVQKVARSYLQSPQTIDLVTSEQTMPSRITNVAIAASASAMDAVLERVIGHYGKPKSDSTVSRCLCFCNTKADVVKYSAAMQASSTGLRAEGLHGDLSQYQREAVLSRFRKGRTTVLFATDVAARGLDIPNVETVVHVTPAQDEGSFVHRSGRTGRAGAAGVNVVLYDPDNRKQRDQLAAFQRTNSARFQPTAVPVVQAASQKLEDTKRALRSASYDAQSAAMPGSTDTESSVAALVHYVHKLVPDPEQAVLLLARAALMTDDGAQFSLLTGKPNFVTATLDTGRSDKSAYNTLAALETANVHADVVAAWAPTPEGAVMDIPMRLWSRIVSAGVPLTPAKHLPPSLSVADRRRSLSDALRGHSRRRGGGGNDYHARRGGRRDGHRDGRRDGRGRRDGGFRDDRSGRYAARGGRGQHNRGGAQMVDDRDAWVQRGSRRGGNNNGNSNRRRNNYNNGGGGGRSGRQFADGGGHGGHGGGQRGKSSQRRNAAKNGGSTSFSNYYTQDAWQDKPPSVPLDFAEFRRHAAPTSPPTGDSASSRRARRSAFDDEW